MSRSPRLSRCRWRLIVCGLVTLLAAFAAAPVAHADNGIARCLATQQKAEKDGEACIGRIADACLERPGGYSTAGQAACAERELKVWDKLLNAHYKGLMSLLDTAAKKEKLKSAQRLWLKLRDADCELAHHFFDGGTMAVPMMRYCMMKTTARRALMLRQWQESLSPR